jgi:hypothetical protein
MCARTHKDLIIFSIYSTSGTFYSSSIHVISYHVLVKEKINILSYLEARVEVGEIFLEARVGVGENS